MGILNLFKKEPKAPEITFHNRIRLQELNLSPDERVWLTAMQANAITMDDMVEQGYDQSLVMAAIGEMFFPSMFSTAIIQWQAEHTAALPAPTSTDPACLRIYEDNKKGREISQMGMFDSMCMLWGYASDSLVDIYEYNQTIDENVTLATCINDFMKYYENSPYKEELLSTISVSTKYETDYNEFTQFVTKQMQDIWNDYIPFMQLYHDAKHNHINEPNLKEKAHILFEQPKQAYLSRWQIPTHAKKLSEHYVSTNMREKNVKEI